MLDKKVLNELKSQLPVRHSKLIQEAYHNMHHQTVGRHTIIRFFKGQSYSEKLHKAVLSVASTQQSLQSATVAILKSNKMKAII